MIGQFITGHYQKDGSIAIYVRGQDGKKYKIDVYGFNPYFYIPEDEKIPKEIENNVMSVVPVNIPYLYGGKYKKVVVTNPGVVPRLREKFRKTGEADIIFVRRFLIDCGITSGVKVDSNRVRYDEIEPVDYMCDPIVCFIDIEVKTQYRFPNVKEAKFPIISVTLWDSRNDYYHTIILDNKTGFSKNQNHSIYRFTLESELIRKVRNILQDINPDVISGWNVDFDIEYLKNRSNNVQVPIDFRSMCIFDLYNGYKKIFGRAGRLKDVVISEGITDTVVSEEFHLDMYYENRDEFIQYNLDDVKFCVLIDQKRKIIKHFWGLKNIVGLEDMKSTLYHGILIDALFLRKCKGRYILPTNTKKEDIDEALFQGAVCYSPEKGIHHNIAVFDMSRYYPSIAVSKNLSPEPHEGKLGLVPELCIELSKQRDVLENEMKKHDPGSKEYEDVKFKRNQYKYLLNAVYGYVSSPYFRLFNVDIGGKITEYARRGINRIKKIAENKGKKVLYGDTDSVHISVDNLVEAKQLESYLNQELAKWCKEEGMDTNIKLKLEKIYKTILFTGVKKRYAGRICWESDKDVDYLDITGFEYVRRDASPLTRKLQKQVFEMILYDKTDKILDLIKKTIIDVKNGKYDIEFIAPRKGIRKNLRKYKSETDFLRGIKYANKYLGLDIRTGDDVKIIWVKRVGNGLPPTDIICFFDQEQLPKDLVVDYDKVVEKTIIEKLKKITNLIGLRIESMPEISKAKTGMTDLMSVFGG